MRVVVPFTSVRPETVAALQAQTPNVELVDVSGSVTGYWSLLAELWAAGEDFAVVEHDIVIAPGTLAAFERCPRPWCSAPAAGEPRRRGWQVAYLQCNRFRREAMVAHPALMDLPSWSRHWLGLDGQVLPRLERRIGPPHIHGRPTRHLQGPGHEGHFPAWTPDAWSPVVREFAVWLAEFAPEGANYVSLMAQANAHLAAGEDDAEATNRLAEAVYLRGVLQAHGAGLTALD